ncbi:MAG: polyphosphate kinase [Verrucomicrobia bacterium Tous-C9LFEB]|nr:MAG: polyphosphate kinase [Verrucomicrobia bacterium Tous-C9LFEB]
MGQPFVVTPKIKLKQFDPNFSNGLDKDEIREETAQLHKRIGELQYLLYSNANHAVVVLFQGMDAAGKDSSVRNLLVHVNPAGVETANFKEPSSEERAHDFLWRIHKAVPRYGNIGVFNRSHYEEVLVARVNKLVPKEIWQARYAQINAFEKILAQNNVILLKFFLHLSKEEQAERLRDRLQDPRKNWEFRASDLDTRAHWDEYQVAFEDMLNECSTPACRWHVLPADRKWYRDYLVAKRVVEALEDLKMSWPKPKEDLSKIKIV